jgi:hypothetical protein
LGWFYWRRDRRLSRRWYEKAARAGDRQSMYYVALLLDPVHWSTVWQGRRYREARGWLEKAASMGDPWAQLRLGHQLLFWHRSGLGISAQRFAQARDWLERAATSDNVEVAVQAASVLGLALEWTEPAASVHWDEIAVALGDRWAGLRAALTLGPASPSKAARLIEDALGFDSRRHRRLLGWVLLRLLRALERERRRKRGGDTEDDLVDNGSIDQRVNQSWSGPHPAIHLFLRANDPVVGCVCIGREALRWAQQKSRPKPPVAASTIEPD